MPVAGLNDDVVFARADFARRLLAMCGIDGAIGWTAAARVWSVVAGPLTLVVIATSLTPEQQGFYYTFGSVVALQIFFELGLAYVVQNFTSHEKAFLEWRPGGTISGSEVRKGRIAALLRKSLWWYGVASVLLTVSLIIGGTFFFGQRLASGAAWWGPWIATVVFACASLVMSPIFAVLEGCGAVLDVARMRTGQAIVSSLAAWTVLLGGGGLWASPAISAAGLAVGATWLLIGQRRFLFDLIATAGTISWREEIWPFQWRIALSFASGYFIFQLFTPVLFVHHGAAAAGQMGMSLAVVSALFAVSMSWVTTKAPAFGERISRGNFVALDALFFAAMWRALAVMTLGSAAFFAAVVALGVIDHPWSRCFLEPLPLGLLIVATLMNHVVFAESVYLRAHKREPFLSISVANALTVGASTLFLGRGFGATGMMTGFLGATAILSLGGGTWIFIVKRRSWHG